MLAGGNDEQEEAASGFERAIADEAKCVLLQSHAHRQAQLLWELEAQAAGPAAQQAIPAATAAASANEGFDLSVSDAMLYSSGPRGRYKSVADPSGRIFGQIQPTMHDCLLSGLGFVQV